MKKIGFIDYYISEWHANNYPLWIKEACEACGLEYTVAYAYAELDVSPIDGVTTDEWCEKNGTERCLSIDELCEKSDFIVILAPSNPEKHLDYARAALKWGKRTYIDKTFAQDYLEASEIFDIAKKHGAPFFSTSALRYASELSDISPDKRLFIRGGGSNLPEYIIHQVEMLVKLFGIGAKSVTAELRDGFTYLNVFYNDGKMAKLCYEPSLPFAVGTDYDGNKLIGIKSSFFNSLISDLLRFFEDGRCSFDTAETLEVMKIREAIIKSIENYGQQVDF
jgi:hypothetical protein